MSTYNGGSDTFAVVSDETVAAFLPYTILLGLKLINYFVCCATNAYNTWNICPGIT